MPSEVQKKMFDVGFKILSACMIPVLAWAYHLSIDVALMKANEKAVDKDIIRIEGDIKRNSSSISTLNEETNKIIVIETNVQNMANQLDKAEKSLDKILDSLRK
jgi:hypothetical protein